MLRIITGNLFDAPQAVVAHGCNCQGAMGRGIALGMRQRFPRMFEHYRSLCLQGKFRPGQVLMWKTPTGWIANLATQDNWGTQAVQARPEWIETCLTKLVRWCREHGYSELATPRLGCGLGGLRWEQVEPIFERLASDFDIWVYDIRGEI